MPDNAISVIIPTLNEADNITRTLARIGNNMEIIIVDGGSADKTAELAAGFRAKVLSGSPGRAKQMNMGAMEAKGGILLFLHADTLLPEGFEEIILRIIKQPGIAAGAFRLAIDSPQRGLRIIERLANWRSRYLQTPYGDQAIFVKTELFHKLGGFPEIPIMEDLEFIRQLRKAGRISIASVPVITSARRWHKLGIWKTTLINQIAIVTYFLGIPPAAIARWYYPRP